MAVQVPNLGPGNTLIYNPHANMPNPLYDQASVQYANRFHAEDASMRPGIIFYARDEADVVTVLKFAATQKAKLALRTGGHQYSGASSTTRENFLLDLSRCQVEEHLKVLDETDGTITIRMGINQDLRSLNEWLRDTHSACIPHGHCAHVHLGGHVQSGGYGHSARAFGLLADHVVGMRVYTADGVRHDLDRAALVPGSEDAELFFAMLGGSPGNFGVLVRIDLCAVRAAAHPKARGMALYGLYNGDTMQKLLDLLAKWSDDEELPAGFDYTLTVISVGRPDVLPKKASARTMQEGIPFLPEAKAAATANPPPSNAKTIFDKLGFPDEGVDDFLQQLAAAQLDPVNYASMAVTIVWVQWANLKGDKEDFSADLEARFQAVRDAGWWPVLKEFDARNPGQDLAHMSTTWAFDIKREFHLPYHKRCHVTTRDDLATSGYADFLTNQLTEAVRVDKWAAGLRIVMQTQLYAGRASAFTHGDPTEQSCHAWRRKMRGVLVVDAFYVRAPPLINGEDDALEWVHQNTDGLLGPDGCYSREDLRVLWGSFENNPAELNLNAPAVWPFYFRDAETVERLRRTKANRDPAGLLTPNLFCIRPVP